MAEPLEELQKYAVLGRLMAGVAHEMSTPLASIASNNDLARRSLEALASEPLPEKAARIVEALRGTAAVDQVACERVALLLRSMKTLAREQEAPADADLNQLLRDALRLVEHEYRGRVAVETDLGQLPPFRCQPQALGQVFLNLLLNAGQSIEGKGCVSVRSRLENEVFHIEICDTGCGIAPEARERVFSSGYTTKPPGAGTGLGLAISREIVERHGGTIDFESRPGAGTTFHVRLPSRK